MPQSEVCFEHSVFVTLFGKMTQPNMWNLGLCNSYCSCSMVKGYFTSQNLFDAALSSNYLLKYDWIIYKNEEIICSTKGSLCFDIIYFKN